MQRKFFTHNQEISFEMNFYYLIETMSLFRNSCISNKDDIRSFTINNKVLHYMVESTYWRWRNLAYRVSGDLWKEFKQVLIMKKLETPPIEKQRSKWNKRRERERERRNSRKTKNRAVNHLLQSNDFQSPNKTPDCWPTTHAASLNCQDHWKCQAVVEIDSNAEVRKKYFIRIYKQETKFPFE